MILEESLKDCFYKKFLKSINFFTGSFLASIFIVLFSNIKLYFPFSPIPIVFQMQAIFLLALFLDKSKAISATVLFLFQGYFFPFVFSSGLSLFGITFGYLMGYLLSAVVISIMMEKNKSLKMAFFSITISTIAVYLMGAYVLSLYVGIKKAFFMGVFPFVFPDILKNLIVVKIFKMKRNKNRKIIV